MKPRSKNLSTIFSACGISILEGSLLSRTGSLIRPNPSFFILFILIVLIFSFMAFNAVSASSMPSTVCSIGQIPVPYLFFMLSVTVPKEYFIPYFSSIGMALRLKTSPYTFLILSSAKSMAAAFPMILSAAQKRDKSFFSLSSFKRGDSPLPFSSMNSLPSYSTSEAPFLRRSFAFSILFIEFV